ncbi:hypothetical protein [Bacillus toyonensis]|uniref:hypothetical protein n=1 Tax=Bacillus toyonensis TaxID=155322 RepID=UPI000BF9CDA9|nr:hypothetical protein [Bacillus toyonensis]PGF05315.1 hypothetical protein COM61_02575 [Bacillus toyonensis]
MSKVHAETISGMPIYLERIFTTSNKSRTIVMPPNKQVLPKGLTGKEETELKILELADRMIKRISINMGEYKFYSEVHKLLGKSYLELWNEIQQQGFGSNQARNYILNKLHISNKPTRSYLLGERQNQALVYLDRTKDTKHLNAMENNELKLRMKVDKILMRIYLETNNKELVEYFGVFDTVLRINYIQLWNNVVDNKLNVFETINYLVRVYEKGLEARTR